MALTLCLLAVLALYAPVLRIGLVAEDFQFALKGAKIAEHPLEVMQPFQLVWRPAVYVLFAVLAWAVGPVAVWYRAAQLAAGLALAAVGWAFLRRVAGLGPWLAAASVVAWLASPLASEPLCGEASFVGHLLFAGSVLLALWLHAGRPSRWRAAGVGLAMLVAAACKEEWIVVPIMVVAEDLALHGRPLREAVRGARWWLAAAGGYLAVYGVITHFRYAGFYQPSLGGAAAKSLYTLVSFLQLAGPLPGGFPQALADAPLRAAAALFLLGAMVAVAVVRRLSRPLLLFGFSALSATPTLLGAAQAARWTLLPWFFFLAGAIVWLRESKPALWRRRPLRAGGGLLLLLLAANGAATTRGDLADWAGIGRLTAALSTEAEPLLPEGARGRCLVVLRGDDSERWVELVSDPAGQPKAFFPRPNDPYGIVSLSALLSWRTYRRGWVLERVETLPKGSPAVAFVHVEGGFRRLAEVPAFEVRYPTHPQRGAPGVILMPRPWAGFAPREFP